MSLVDLFWNPTAEVVFCLEPAWHSLSDLREAWLKAAPTTYLEIYLQQVTATIAQHVLQSFLKWQRQHPHFKRATFTLQLLYNAKAENYFDAICPN